MSTSNTKTPTQKLLDRFEKGLPMDPKSLRADDPQLLSDCRHCYGAYARALQAVGIKRK